MKLVLIGMIIGAFLDRVGPFAWWAFNYFWVAGGGYVVVGLVLGVIVYGAGRFFWRATFRG